MSFYKSPTFNLDTNEWSYTEFESRKDTVVFIQSHFKYPGKYNLKYSEGVWNEPAKSFRKNEKINGLGNGHYPKFVIKSVDYKKHWDIEKEKCKFDGFIIYKKPSENLEYAVPCLYYFYLNYCPIPDKVKAKDDFPDIYDGDLHYFLYILQCILLRKYGVVLKKRQSGYTLKNMSILLNAIWFGNSAVSKIFASDEKKVKDSWTFMEKYRDHINRYAGWKRGCDPNKKLDWQIRRKQTDGSYKGNMSIAQGFTTKQDPTNGIGGSATVIFGEESGANPTLDITHEFITSNVALGGLTTGLIMYSGAVGELEKADPLKEFMFHPEDHDFLSCNNYIKEDIELGPKVGFFAPEWWNYVSVEEDEDGNQFGDVLRCFDEWGNSDEAKSLIEIAKNRKKAEKKSPEKFRYYCSQRPLSIKEAFAFRKESVFPLNLVGAQKQRIEDKKYPHEYLEIDKNENGIIEFKKTHKTPIREFPITKTNSDKEGCIEVWERPCVDPVFGMYYATVDPIKDGKSTTSLSLFSIYIYKNDVEVTKVSNGETETFIEPGKIVAAWCGRFDDINDTNRRAQYLIEIYNAWALVEANASEFINHMINQKKQHHLVPKNQIMFLKDLGANLQSFQEYGWKNAGTLFRLNMLPYGVAFLKEEIDHETSTTGQVVKRVYGIERVPDIMLMKEMEAYHPDLNVDRIIAFCALASFVRVQHANRGYVKRVDKDNSTKKLDQSLYTVDKSFFKTRNTGGDSKYNLKKSGFRNLK